MRFYGILYFLISVNAFAYLDCEKRPDVLIDLKKDKIGSLQNALIQDQDGLGTCGANSASLALEAYFGKPISYHQLALAEILEEKEVKISVSSENKFFTEGSAGLCNIIEATKKQFGKVCPREYVSIENMFHYGSYHQGELLKTLGKFYDTYRSLAPNAKKYIIEAIQTANEKIKHEEFEICKSKDQLKFNAYYGLKNIVRYIYFIKHMELKDNSSSPPEEILKLSSFGTHITNPDSTIEMIYHGNILSKISSFLNKRDKIEIKTSLEKEKFITSLLTSILPDNFNLDDFKPFQKNFIFQTITSRYLPDILAYLDPEICKSYQKIKIFNREFKLSCFQENNFNNIFESVKHASDQHFGDPMFIDNLINGLNPENEFKKFYSEILGAKCVNNGINLTNEISCKKIKLPMTPADSISRSFQNENEKIKEEKMLTKKYINGRVSSELVKLMPNGTRGNPIVISLCTKFFNEKGFDFNWGKPKISLTECAKSNKHGLHDVVIIGMRCNEGKVEYKIQNSWGKYNKAIKNPEIKHIDEEGSFWLSEDDLANNIYNMEMLRFKVSK